jgi:hypothetical protein
MVTKDVQIKKDQLTCELNGIKYLLVELQFTDDNKNQLSKAVEEHECILQSVGKVERPGLMSGLFSVVSEEEYSIVRVLVPEKNVVEFNKAIMF